MDDFVDLVTRHPVTVYAVVRADSVEYHAAKTDDTFVHSRTLTFDGTIMSKTPFVNSKIGWFRVEDGELVSYTKKTGQRNSWRSDVVTIYDAVDNKLVVLTKDNKVAFVQLKNNVVNTTVLAPAAFVTLPVIRAFFCNNGTNLVVQHETCVKYYSLKKELLTINIRNHMIVNIAVDPATESFYCATIASEADFISNNKVQVYTCVVQKDTVELSVTPFQLTTFIGFMQAGTQVLYYDPIRVLWVYLAGVHNISKARPSVDGVCVTASGVLVA